MDWINAVPQTAATTFAFFSVFFVYPPSKWVDTTLLQLTQPGQKLNFCLYSSSMFHLYRKLFLFGGTFLQDFVFFCLTSVRSKQYISLLSKFANLTIFFVVNNELQKALFFGLSEE